MNMFKRLSLVFIGVSLFISPVLPMDKGKEKAPEAVVAHASSDIIAMDLDDVMSIKHKVGPLDFIGMVRALFWNPWIMGVLANFTAIKDEGDRIGQRVNGATNTVHAVLQLLRDRGYGDLSYYEDEIVDRATKPEPNWAMVERVQVLKQRGYTVIGATNQDWKQHLAYRAKMKAQGVDLNELFDAVVTTRVKHEQPSHEAQRMGFYWPVANENIYAATDEQAYKPNSGYYDVVKSVARYMSGIKRGGSVRRIIFTDDKKENIDAAQAAGLHAVHFDLPGGKSARKASADELQETVNRWQSKVKAFNVDTD